MERMIDTVTDCMMLALAIHIGTVGVVVLFLEF